MNHDSRTRSHKQNLKHCPVIFFLGSGGVGKSTVSALKAINEALQDKKVLIATFDPSPRLKDILFKQSGFINPTLKENLSVVILNSREIFENLLLSTDELTARNIKNNKLFKHLIERIHGIHEFSSLYFLSENVNSQKYDLIIIDTPPLQNSLDFFMAPKKLKDLFESTIVKLFIGDFNNTWFERIFKKTRDVAFSTLKKLTGHDFFEQLMSFMKALEKLQPIILKTLSDSKNILKSSSTEYAFVTSYEEQNLKTINLQIDLVKAEQISINSLYINKYENDSEEELKFFMQTSEDMNLKTLSEYSKYKYDNIIKKKKSLEQITKQSSFKIHLLSYSNTNKVDEEELILRSKELK